MSFEEQILKAAETAIGEAISDSLCGYNKPLSKLVEQVIEKHRGALFELVDGEVSSLLSSDGFREELSGVLNKKLAQVLINRMGGELEKQVKKLQSDPTTRAKLTLAIDKIVTEFLAK